MTDQPTPAEQFAELSRHDVAMREAFAAFQTAYDARNQVGRNGFQMHAPSDTDLHVATLAKLLPLLPSGDALEEAAATAARNARLNREEAEKYEAEKRATKERDAAAAQHAFDDVNRQLQRRYAERDWEQAKALAELRNEPMPPIPAILREPVRSGAVRTSTAGYR